MQSHLKEREGDRPSQRGGQCEGRGVESRGQDRIFEELKGIQFFIYLVVLTTR